MKIERDKLLAPLQIVRAALADKSQLVGLNYLWLDGKSVVAFNDVIGIEAPLEFDFEGGVMGATMVGLLETSAVKEVDIVADDSDGGSALVLKMPGVKTRLPVLPPDHRVFSFPDTPGEAIAMFEGLSNALKYVGVAIAGDGDNMGVTFVPERAMLALYATDGVTIAWSRVTKPKGYGAGRIVLSPQFCTQLQTLNVGTMTLALTDEFAVASEKETGARLYGRLVEAPRDLDFAGVIARNIGKSKGVPIPEKLAVAIDRSEVFAVVGSQRAPLRMRVEKGVLYLGLESDHGQFSEAIKLGAPHPDVAGDFNGSFIRRCLDRASRFIITADAFVMLGEGDSGCAVAAFA